MNINRITLFALIILALISNGSVYAEIPSFNSDSYPEFAEKLNKLKSMKISESNNVKKFGNAKLSYRGYIRILHLEGTSFEMGYQHGILLKNEILERMTKRAKIKSYFGWTKKKKTLKYIRQADSIILSKYLDEIKGMAAAVNVDYDYMLAFRLIYELRKTACTTVAASKSASKDGNIIYLRSIEDAPDIKFLELMVIIYKPNQSNSFFSLNGPGGVGVYSGMNNKGITIDDNLVMCVKDDFRKDGIPLTFYRRMIIENSNNIEDVQKFIETHLPSASNNIIITDGKTNEMRIFEVSGDRYAVRNTDNDVLASSNHFVDLDVQTKCKWKDSYERYDFAKSYLKDNHGKIDLENMTEFMKSDLLCDKKKRSLQSITIMAPKNLDFYVAVQKPDNNPASFNELVKFNLLEEIK